MNKKLENARNLYLRAIRDAEVDEVLENYMGESYRQHSTGVPDGKAGFAQFFNDFFKRNPDRDIQIIRDFTDGNYVFMQVLQNLNGGTVQWVTADIFKADQNDRIIEHWDVIEAYKKNLAHDQILGDYKIEDVDLTEKNKATVRLFLTEVMQNHDFTKFDNYVAEDVISHVPEISDGSEAYKSYLLDHKVTYDFVFKVLGKGNWVVAYSKIIDQNQAQAHFDIFKLKNNKIVEHFTVTEPIPKNEDLTNSGKF